MGVLPEGYVFRAPVAEEAGAVADLLDAVELAISGIPDTGEERIRWQWSGPGEKAGMQVEREAVSCEKVIREPAT